VSVRTDTRLWAEDRGIPLRFLAKLKYFSVVQSIQTGLAVSPAFCSVDNEGTFLQGK
jgi:hypothetical protein